MILQKNAAGFYSGILQPKMTRFFRVKFFEPNILSTIKTDTRPFHGLDPVVQQIVEVNVPAQQFANTVIFPGSSTSMISFVYEDDVLNQASKALTDFGKSNTSFDMVVEILDGAATAIESIVFSNCKIQSIERLAPLSYKGGASGQSSLSFDAKEIVGNLVEETPGGANMIKLLQEFFSNLEINYDNKDLQETSAIQKRVAILFEKRMDFFREN